MIGALKKLDNLCKKGDSVVIVGAGGGLGHLYEPRVIEPSFFF